MDIFEFDDGCKVKAIRPGVYDAWGAGGWWACSFTRADWDYYETPAARTFLERRWAEMEAEAGTRPIRVVQEWPRPEWRDMGGEVWIKKPDGSVRVYNGDWLGCHDGIPPEVRTVAEQIWAKHQKPEPLTDKELEAAGSAMFQERMGSGASNTFARHAAARAIVNAHEKRQAEIAEWEADQ